MSQIGADVLQVLEAAFSCFYIQQLLLLYAIRAEKATAGASACARGGVHLLGARSEMEGMCPNMAGALVKVRFVHE